MTWIPLTPEEIKEKQLQTVSYNFRNQDDKISFETAFNDPEFSASSDFIKDVKRKWDNSGTLSNKQTDAILQASKRFYKNKHAMTGMVIYRRDEEILLDAVIVESIQEIEVEDRFHRSGTTLTNEVKMKDEKGVTFILKTTAKKLIAKFQEAKDNNLRVDVFSTVSYGNEKRPVLYISAKGAKVCFAD